jgi:nitrite reductase/ring-hydroxylating ferredoxin subunit
MAAASSCRSSGARSTSTEATTASASRANVCLHFGGPLECKDGALVCPWHGARYDMESGLATEGPARKDARLMFLPTRLENGDVNYVWGE